MISAAENGDCDNCGRIARPLALLKYDAGHGLAGYCLDCLAAAAAEIRESGGSLPAAAPSGLPRIARTDPVFDGDPPVLNKSGGSAVPYVCACAANGARDGQHFAGCPNEAKPERGKPLWEP